MRKEHEAAVAATNVWGVPTFVLDDRAVFVRLMNSPTGDADWPATVERILDLLGVARPQRVQAHLHPALSRRRR